MFSEGSNIEAFAYTSELSDVSSSRTEKSFDWLKHRHYEWNTPGQDTN